jgi:hypothetical protein
MALDVPVLFLVFNRPDLVPEVMKVLQVVQPRRLYIAGDGPRAGHPTDTEKCAETRAVIERMVTWPCSVKTNYRAENLGCRRGVQSGISWFFSEVEEGIILEDDTVPSLSFFPFCAELLERYRNDTRIGMISGDNFQFGFARTEASYYFSRYTHIWGWASWRRAWQLYDTNLESWTTLKKQRWLTDILVDDGCSRHWEQIFDQSHAKGIDTWDFQWTYTCWMQNMLTILPNTNLVTNIGFGPTATHTHNATAVANLARHEIKFPLRHPDCVVADLLLDLRSARDVFHITLGPVGAKLLDSLAPVRTGTDIELIDEALDFIATHDFASALTRLDSVSSSGAKLGNLQYLRAVCLLTLSRPAEAVQALRAELSAFPDQAEARELLSRIGL